MAAMWAHPATVRHFGGHPLSREESWRRLLACTGLWPIQGFGYWAVERKEDGLLVGQVGLAEFQRELHPSIKGTPEAGWVVAPDACGQGIASEGVATMLEWADRTLNVPEITAIIAHANSPSIKLAEKNGFGSREEALYKGEPILIFRRASPTAAAAAA